jgi:hypothetical protein
MKSPTEIEITLAAMSEAEREELRWTLIRSAMSPREQRRILARVAKGEPQSAPASGRKLIVAAVVAGVLFYVLLGSYLYVVRYLPAKAEQQRMEAGYTAQSIACNAMYQAALEGRVALTPRDEAYCQEVR